MRTKTGCINSNPTVATMAQQPHPQLGIWPRVPPSIIPPRLLKQQIILLLPPQRLQTPPPPPPPNNSIPLPYLHIKLPVPNSSRVLYAPRPSSVPQSVSITSRTYARITRRPDFVDSGIHVSTCTIVVRRRVGGRWNKSMKRIRSERR